MKALNLIIISLSVILLSCGKKLMDPSLNENIPIVQSYISAGDSIIRVKANRLISYDVNDTNAIPVSGLSIKINDYILTETQTGLYQYKLINQKIQPGENYTLSFVYNTLPISSTTTIPKKTQNFKITPTVVAAARIVAGQHGGFGQGSFSPIELTWDNTDRNYHYIVLQYLEPVQDFINQNMLGQTHPTVRSFPPVQDYAFEMNNRTLLYFGRYRVILYSVNKEYADLFEQTSQSSNSLSNPSSNITNGWGIFTGLNSDTLNLQVIEAK